MPASTARADWEQGQDALRAEVGRVTSLLRSIQDPGTPAVGNWNLGDVALHLSQAWILVTCMARRDLSPIHALIPSTAGVGGGSVTRDMWAFDEVTNGGVKADPEREPAVLADRIKAQAEQYFSACAGEDPDEPRSWVIEGTTVRQSTLTYHLLSETVMHGVDIAHAAGRPWRITPSHAAMVLGRFIVPVIQAAGPRVFVNGVKAAGLRATYGIRIRGGDSFLFLFDDGSLTVEAPSGLGRRVDCHISADPVAFLMVLWARQSQWSAIAKGKLMAWGRKPWLGLQLRGLIRNP
jgi:uncharacterized protein (TIGR03083 family)